VGPPPAAALTLTTGLPGDSPAFPVRRTLRGCPVPRTTTEPQRNPATGTLLRSQAEAPLPAAEGPALGRSLRKRAPFPGSKWPHGPRPQSRMPFKVFESAGPLGWRMCYNISQYRRAFASPQQGPRQATSLPWTAAGPCGGILARFAIFTHALLSARPTQLERFVSAEVGKLNDYQRRSSKPVTYHSTERLP
jgi:hypothetical protein